jgi:hypothetical protein
MCRVVEFAVLTAVTASAVIWDVTSCSTVGVLLLFYCFHLQSRGVSQIGRQPQLSLLSACVFLDRLFDPDVGSNTLNGNIHGFSPDYTALDPRGWGPSL